MLFLISTDSSLAQCMERINNLVSDSSVISGSQTFRWSFHILANPLGPKYLFLEYFFRILMYYYWLKGCLTALKKGTNSAYFSYRVISKSNCLKISYTNCSSSILSVGYSSLRITGTTTYAPSSNVIFKVIYLVLANGSNPTFLSPTSDVFLNTTRDIQLYGLKCLLHPMCISSWWSFIVISEVICTSIV